MFPYLWGGKGRKKHGSFGNNEFDEEVWQIYCFKWCQYGVK